MLNDDLSNMSMDINLPPHPIMVVLVDDQPMVAESIRRMLQDEHDIDMHYCMHAEKALAMVDDIQPTLILQDLVMPHTDGLDLLRDYRSGKTTRDVPVVVLSSKEDPKIKAKAFALGANDYMIKLPDKVELVARIRYHSQWYINKLQRDDAYRSLQASQRRLEELNLSLYQMTRKDALTGIINRGRFNEIFADEWQRVKREKQHLSLIMIDIDFFKAYNDHLGHLAGDTCLKKVAEILRSTLHRPSDIVARYGGEEFVVLLPNTVLSGASKVAEELRSHIAAASLSHPESTVAKYITISLGVAASIPSGLYSSDKLIKAADDALYQAKQEGRNRIVVQQKILSSAEEEKS